MSTGRLARCGNRCETLPNGRCGRSVRLLEPSTMMRASHRGSGRGRFVWAGCGQQPDLAAEIEIALCQPAWPGRARRGERARGHTIAAAAVVPGCSAALRKLITWVSQARGAVARPRVCPACGTTHTWTVPGDRARATWLAVAEPDGTAAPSGVCANTFSSRMSAHVARVLTRHPHPYLPRSHINGHRALGVLDKRPPEFCPLRDHHPGLAHRLIAGTGRAASVLDDLANRALNDADIVKQLGLSGGVTQRLGVDAQRGERGAQAVRQVGDGLPLVGKQLANTRRQVVQPGAHAADLGGARQGGSGG